MKNRASAAFCDNSVHGEDTLVVRDLGEAACLDAVLDGVTHCEGAYASGFTAQLLQDAQISSLQDVTRTLEEANTTLFQSGRGRNLLTTVSLSLKLGDELHVINVGDSPVYLVRGGEIRELSSIVRSGLLASLPNGAVGLKERLAYKHRRIDVHPHDRIVLATDGLLDNVSPGELASIVAGSRTPEDAISALKALLEEKRRNHRGRADTYGTFREDDRTAVLRYLA